MLSGEDEGSLLVLDAILHIKEICASHVDWADVEEVDII